MKCHTCDHIFADDEMAWADDWKVIETNGTTVTIRSETRYMCDECEASR